MNEGVELKSNLTIETLPESLSVENFECISVAIAKVVEYEFTAF